MKQGEERRRYLCILPDQRPFARVLDTSALPAVVERATWQAELDTLRVREKAHTREGDAIAAAHRRLPMVEVDPSIQLVGPHGPVSLLSVLQIHYYNHERIHSA